MSTITIIATIINTNELALSITELPIEYVKLIHHYTIILPVVVGVIKPGVFTFKWAG